MTGQKDSTKPMFNMPEFHSLLNALRMAGYKVIILSWLSKNDDPDFHKRIIATKKNWIKKYNILVGVKEDINNDLGGK